MQFLKRSLNVSILFSVFHEKRIFHLRSINKLLISKSEANLQFFSVL